MPTVRDKAIIGNFFQAQDHEKTNPAFCPLSLLFDVQPSDTS